jgi:adenylate kinase
MMCGITGNPGTGKSTLGDELARRGYPVVRILDTIGPYVVGRDSVRDTRIIDDEWWAEEFPHVEGFVEGLLAHYLPCDRVVVLRCRPDMLRERLRNRGYAPDKIRENIEAEALDVILIEALERQPADSILEIDTTFLSTGDVADRTQGFMEGRVPPSHGTIDWSSYLVGGL